MDWVKRFLDNGRELSETTIFCQVLLNGGLELGQRDPKQINSEHLPNKCIDRVWNR